MPHIISNLRRKITIFLCRIYKTLAGRSAYDKCGVKRLQPCGGQNLLCLDLVDVALNHGNVWHVLLKRSATCWIKLNHHRRSETCLVKAYVKSACAGKQADYRQIISLFAEIPIS